MTSLERARHFVAGKTAKLALAIVPLAALSSVAPCAQASTVRAPFGFQTSSCSVYPGTGTCSTSANAAPGHDPDGGSVSLYTVGGISPNAGHAAGVGVSGGTAFGTVLTNEQIPVSWDFYINPFTPVMLGGNDPSTPTASWSLNFAINGGSGTVANFSQNGSGVAYGSHIVGSGFLVPATGGSITNFNISLTVTGTDSSFQLMIPAASTLDLNTPTAAAPEPASLGLFAAGFVGLAGLFARRKRQSSRG